jgi:outer membrane protein assembly factor BamB
MRTEARSVSLVTILHCTHPVTAMAPFVSSCGSLLSLLLSTSLVAAEWHQWRGAERNGISDDRTPLVRSIPDAGLPVLWQSDVIPSDHDGGHGSPVVAKGRVYLSLVWHVHVPSARRVIEDEHLVSLGYRDTGLLGPALTAELEQVRKTLPAGLRGEALSTKVREWVQEHFNDEQRLILGSWAEWRLGQKSAAVDLEVLGRIRPKVDQPFASHEEMVQWLTDAGIKPEVQEKLLKLVPATIKEAQDVILCLDLATGRTLWKYQAPGKPVDRAASSTCTVVDGTVYALGSTHLHAVDAQTGVVRWRREVGKSQGSSPLVEGDKLWYVAEGLYCLSTRDGAVLWQKPKLKGGHSSPVLWKVGSQGDVLLCASGDKLSGVDPASGEVRWELPGGGPSTPVVQEEWLVFLSDDKEAGLQAFRAQPEGPPSRQWSHFWLASRYSSSPVIYGGHVYLMEGGRHLCASLENGTLSWDEKVESTISSPVLADGRLWSLEQNGMFLRGIAADPAAYHLSGRTKVEALWCPTPLIAEGRLILRRKDRVVCLDLRQK